MLYGKKILIKGKEYFMCSDIFLIIENLFISAPHFTKIAQSCLMYMPYYREKNGERKSKGAGRRNKAIM